MRIYIAGRYGRRAELADYARELERAGHEVVSRWLFERPAELGDLTELDILAEPDLWPVAQEVVTQNIRALRSAELAIFFTDAPHVSHPHGGRHVEYGISLGLAQRRMIVGYRESIFHCVSDMVAVLYPTWARAFAAIGSERAEAGQ